MKTIMANDLKGDLKDNVGTFNLADRQVTLKIGIAYLKKQRI